RRLGSCPSANGRIATRAAVVWGKFAAAVELFHFLLDGAGKRKQPAVDRGRRVANEFDHTAPVFKYTRFPDQVIAELIDLGLIALRFILQRLKGEGVGPDLSRGSPLLARYALKPVHQR